MHWIVFQEVYLVTTGFILAYYPFIFSQSNYLPFSYNTRYILEWAIPTICTSLIQVTWKKRGGCSQYHIFNSDWNFNLLWTIRMGPTSWSRSEHGFELICCLGICVKNQKWEFFFTLIWEVPIEIKSCQNWSYPHKRKHQRICYYSQSCIPVWCSISMPDTLPRQISDLDCLPWFPLWSLVAECPAEKECSGTFCHFLYRWYQCT